MVRFEIRGALLLALLALLSQPTHVLAAPNAFDIDVKELDGEKAAPQKAKTPKPRKEPARKTQHQGHPAKHSPAPDGFVRYTIKPGDHLFKILITQFGMSNEKAEHLIPEILRVNHIDNIKGLTVGKVILIPLERSHGGETAKREAAQPRREPAPTHTKETEPVGVARVKEVVAAKKTEAEVKPANAPPVAAPAKPAETTAAKKAEAAPAKGAEPAPALAAIAPPPKHAEPAAPPVVVVSPVVADPLKPAPVKSAPVAATPAPPRPEKPAVHAEPVIPKSAPAPAPVVAKKEVPAPPAPLAPPALPVAVAAPLAVPTWICSVPDSDPHHVVDAMMNALSLKWSKNHVVRSDEGAKTAFSVMVDRYFELKGKRYIITAGEIDPYNYTLLRLLENSGYKVLRLKKGEGFEVLGEKLLRLVGIPSAFGNHFVGGTEGAKKGFLLGEDDTGGRRIVVTRESVAQDQKRVLAAGCGGN
ncbi:LysM peptidoglycan-binding domain-containing protein [Geomesophilobacter sediminis]|uniref:LysM peptidoglycan-binding domain-containing protein n=1 Tax=Geomesophilobacter sediminis TaxID=2798584 RepID=A0A8J7IZT0_9BACT|nr:LysM peptidoglycan-binding domain-containing protein [Geomesophilobacter sediminis]MBJ6725642.1 LysM peptidoglycan-binding domain-containing protein [Geomesophilobacter sediminis]